MMALNEEFVPALTICLETIAAPQSRFGVPFFGYTFIKIQKHFAKRIEIY